MINSIAIKVFLELGTVLFFVNYVFRQQDRESALIIAFFWQHDSRTDFVKGEMWLRCGTVFGDFIHDFIQKQDLANDFYLETGFG